MQTRIQRRRGQLARRADRLALRTNIQRLPVEHVGRAWKFTRRPLQKEGVSQFVLLVCHLQDMMSHILDRRSA